MNSKVMKVISAAILGYLVIMTVTAALGSMVDNGVMLKAWYAMLDYIPFGSVWAPICVTMFGEAFDLGQGLAEYTIGIKAFTAVDFFEDTAILMLTAVFFYALENALEVGMNIKGRGGFHNVLLKMISSMVSALLCSIVAAIVLNYLCDQLEVLSSTAQGIISGIVSVVIVAGAVGVLYFVLGIGIAGAILFVFGRIILINVLKVYVTYTAMMFILLFLAEEAYTKVFAAIGAWGVILVILVGLDMMLSAVFKN